jgi:hypothetical protein
MSVSKETLDEHRHRLYQGALYLIDNPGEPLPDVAAPKRDIRRFQNRVILSHLARHTYYFQEAGKSDLSPVDIECMRRQVGYLYTRAATPSAKEKRPEHSNVDRLFYTGTDGLRANFLEKYNYDKSTFSEADLPAYRESEEGNVVNDGLKQNSNDAEALGDGDKGQDDHSNSNKDKDNVVEDSNVLKQGNQDRAGHLPEAEQTKDLPSLTNTHAQVQGVDAAVERKGNTEVKKRPGDLSDPSEDGAPAEHISKVTRLSNAASSTKHPLPTTETRHATNAPMSTTPPIRLDTSVLEKELKRLSQDTLRASDAVLRCIGPNIFQYPTGLDPEPPQQLLSLYVRCWGKDWEEVRLRLTRNYSFTAPEVAMSLVSAFLYHNVLDQEASLLDDLARLRSLASVECFSQAICHFLQPGQRWSHLKASAHAAHTTEAYTRLAQDWTVVQAQLVSEAEELATSLWSIIVPHFRAVSSFARVYRESSSQPEEAWMEVFKSDLNKIIQRSLRHKLRLLGTGCEHVYTWPNTGEEYDSRIMCVDGFVPDGPDSGRTVLFTVFPGLEVTAPDGSGEILYIKAVVKIQLK